MDEDAEGDHPAGVVEPTTRLTAHRLAGFAQHEQKDYRYSGVSADHGDQLELQFDVRWPMVRELDHCQPVDYSYTRVDARLRWFLA